MEQNNQVTAESYKKRTDEPLGKVLLSKNLKLSGFPTYLQQNSVCSKDVIYLFHRNKSTTIFVVFLLFLSKIT